MSDHDFGPVSSNGWMVCKVCDCLKAKTMGLLWRQPLYEDTTTFASDNCDEEVARKVLRE